LRARARARGRPMTPRPAAPARWVSRAPRRLYILGPWFMSVRRCEGFCGDWAPCPALLVRARARARAGGRRRHPTSRATAMG